MGISPKVIELAYYDSAVHRFNHYTTRTPSKKKTKNAQQSKFDKKWRLVRIFHLVWFKRCVICWSISHKNVNKMNCHEKKKNGHSVDKNATGHTFIMSAQEMSFLNYYFITENEKYIWCSHWHPGFIATLNSLNKDSRSPRRAVYSCISRSRGSVHGHKIIKKIIFGAKGCS